MELELTDFVLCSVSGQDDLGYCCSGCPVLLEDPVDSLSNLQAPIISNTLDKNSTKATRMKKGLRVLVCFHASPHRLGGVLVRVLRRKVLQGLLVVTVVDVVAVDLEDDLSGLKPRPRRLPTCKC